MEPILVIGGTGHIGREVVSQLAASGTPVRSLARNPEAAPVPPHVDVIRGDLTRPDSLGPALDGVDTVFLVWVAPPAAAAAALERIARNAKRIVYLSAPLKTQHPFFQQPNSSRVLAEQIERLIETSGLRWTHLRPGMFSLNSLHFWGPQIRAGDTVRWPCLDAPTAPIHEHDIAAVAVRALCEESHDGAEYVITGPESLTQAEQIETIGRAIGRPLRLQEMSPEEARRELLPVLGTDAVVTKLLDAWRAALGQPAYVSSTFQDVMGRPPQTFLDWATLNSAAFSSPSPDCTSSSQTSRESPAA